MSDKPRFGIGDVVYSASYGNQQEKKLCPVCFGKRKVKLTLGDESEVMLDCAYCATGYDLPLGYVMEYVERGRVEKHIVSSIDSKITSEGTEYTYHAGHYYLYEHKVFATEKDAQVEADKLAAKHAEEEKTRADYIKKDKNKSYSWNAGYHTREAKRNRESADRHERLARICKTRSKDKTEGGAE